MLLGKITGSVTTKEFDFTAESRIKKLQYLAVKDFEGRWILSYVDQVIKYQARTLGKARVIGFRDSRGFLKSLSVPFEPETPVYTADDDLIRKTVGIKDDGLYIGSLTGYKIKVALPVKHVMTKHVAILAKSGAGKSYAAGVLLEELIEKGVPAVVIDPHGEYSTIINKNTKEEEVRQMDLFGIEPKGYPKETHIFTLRTNHVLKLDGRLTPEELFEMLPAKISSAQKGVLYTAIKNLSGKDYTLRDVIDEVDAMETNSKWSLISLLEMVENTKLFSANPTKPEELVSKGQLTIIDLKEAKPEIQQIVCMKVAKELFQARKYGKIPEFLLVVEEAHNFCPERGFGEVASSKILRTLASEGRKFGLGLCIISQRPAKVDKNVLSQCSTQIILKVTNPNDLRAIMESVEGVEIGSKEEIKDMPIGAGMIVGVTEQPLMVDIRIRRSLHGGEALRIEPGQAGPEETVACFSPKFTEEDVRKSFKGVDTIIFMNYPIWKGFGVASGNNTEFFVDGITGELVFPKDDSVAYSKGMRSLVDMPPSQRSILLYLMKNRNATVDKIAADLKMLMSNVQATLKALGDKGLVTPDGYMFKSVVDLNLPQSPDQLKLGYSETPGERKGEFLDFMVSHDFVRKVGEMWDVHVLEVTPVYYPFWLVSHKDKKFMIDAMSNKLDMEKSVVIRKIFR